jgi:hypothetical protein
MKKLCLLSVLFMVVAARSLHSQQLTVQTDAGKQILSRADLEALPHVKVMVSEHSRLSASLLVEAADGYRVVIAHFDKLDGVGGKSPNGGQLCNHTRGNLNATLIPHEDNGPDRQLAIRLNGSSVPIQVGGAGGHGKGTFLPILPRQPYRSADGYPIGPDALLADCDEHWHRLFGRCGGRPGEIPGISGSY